LTALDPDEVYKFRYCEQCAPPKEIELKRFAFHERTEEQESQDHILEYLYDRSEKRKTVSLESIQKLFKEKFDPSVIKQITGQMESSGLITTLRGDLQLTDKGIDKAQLLVRGHRLAQRLMVDVLGISAENAQKTAHYMEHIIDTEILDAISAFLGHPDTSPDGKKIPSQGKKKIFTLKPVLCRLIDMEVGSSGEIRYIQNPEKTLANMGIIPGETIRLQQKRPSVVIELGHTTLAIDREIGEEIFVHPDRRQG